MVQAARGIPAWRSPLTPWLMLATSLAEGAGLWLVLAAFTRQGHRRRSPWGSDVACAGAPACVFRAYRRSVDASLSRDASRALDRASRIVLLGGHGRRDRPPGRRGAVGDPLEPLGARRSGAGGGRRGGGDESRDPARRVARAGLRAAVDAGPRRPASVLAMAKRIVVMTVNGRRREEAVDDATLLLDYLREQLGAHRHQARLRRRRVRRVHGAGRRRAACSRA